MSKNYKFKVEQKSEISDLKVSIKFSSKWFMVGKMHRTYSADLDSRIAVFEKKLLKLFRQGI